MYNVLCPFSKNKSWTCFWICMYRIVKIVSKIDGPSQQVLVNVCEVHTKTLMSLQWRSDVWHVYKLQKPQNDTQTLFIKKEKNNNKKKKKIKSPLIIAFQGGSEIKNNVSKL